MATSSASGPTASAPPTGDQQQQKRPAFIPLEANPELMTSLLHKLGLSPALQIHDVYSITEPELLAFIPRPALALLLVFPVSAAYTSHRLAEDAAEKEYTGSGDAEPVLWYRQTIRNACGLMGLLHAVSNGPAKGFVQEGTPLARLIEQSVPLKPAQRSALLEQTPELATAHAEAASQGDTVAPDAQDDVDLHYVCFVKTEDGEGKGGTLWELDGNRKGPIRRGTLGSDEDVLSEKALLWGPLQFLEREGADMRFSCVALAGSLD
ncbi:ubiquitin carboxyl-terminal hydrolase L3 [Microdochium nivale]|nr:ubiquitin carboxyl-terminal hydrolase L3 [Microdochium nivale]